MKYDDTTLQAAIDAAFTSNLVQPHGSLVCGDTQYPQDWKNEFPARLALAKAFLAKLPQPEPILADDGKSLGQVAWEAGNEVQKRKFPDQEILLWEQGEELHEQLEAAAQAVAAVVEARIIQRMEAVPTGELKNKWVQYEADTETKSRSEVVEIIRARLIAAARGEEQQVPLGPEDVPPGSVIRAIETTIQSLVIRAINSGMLICGQRGQTYEVTFDEAFEDWQINRSIPLTGKWDANAWEPCYKLI